MKFARVFLNPLGTRWVDFGLLDHQTVPILWQQIQNENGIFGGTAAIPLPSIHHITVGEADVAPPNLYTIPGGKPN